MTFDATTETEHNRSELFQSFARHPIENAERDETPQEAAERIWRASSNRATGYGGDPVQTMQEFDAWATQSPSRIIAVLGRDLWMRAVRNFLRRPPSRSGGWKHGAAFQRALEKVDQTKANQSVADWHEKKRLDHDGAFKRDAPWSRYNRIGRERKKRGRRSVRVEVDMATGAVVNLIDKEYGPFAHIRINGLKLPECTTEEALAHCDRKSTDIKFIRALCHLIPDPRKPIGAQWTADIIREAKEVAERGEAA